MKELPVLTHHTDWIYLLLLLSAGTLLWAKLTAPKRFLSFLNLPLHTKRNELIGDFRPFQGLKRFETLLSVHSYAMFALAIFVVHRAQQQNPAAYFGHYLDFIRILFFVLLFFLGKALLNALLEWLYEHDGELSFASNVNLSYRVWSAFYLLPLIALVVYVRELTFLFSIILGIFIGLSYILGVIQSNLILWKMSAPSYLKFLYICALEMMPIFFLLKWLFW